MIRFPLCRITTQQLQFWHQFAAVQCSAVWWMQILAFISSSSSSFLSETIEKSFVSVVIITNKLNAWKATMVLCTWKLHIYNISILAVKIVFFFYFCPSVHGFLPPVAFTSWVRLLLMYAALWFRAVLQYIQRWCWFFSLVFCISFTFNLAGGIIIFHYIYSYKLVSWFRFSP